MQSSEWFLLYSFPKIFLAFVILRGNKIFCKNKRNIPHQCERNRPSSEGGKYLCKYCVVDPGMMKAVRWTWRSYGYTCLVSALSTRGIDSRRLEEWTQNTRIYNGDAVGPPNLMYQIVMLLRRDIGNDVASDSIHACVISGFRRDVDEFCDILDCYTAWDVKSIPTFRDYLSTFL